jgi:hypothetical protein
VISALLASAASAGSLRLTVQALHGEYLLRASGTYDVSPIELDVWVHRGSGGCPSSNATEKSRVEHQVQSLGTAAAGEPIYYRFGTGLMMSGSYSQQGYWGLGAPRGTYWACAFLLVPHSPGHDPSDPPQATASRRLSIPPSKPTACGAAASAAAMLRDGKRIRSRDVTVVVGEPIRLTVSGCQAVRRSARWEVQGASMKLADTSAVRDYLVENAGVNSRTVVEYLRPPALPQAFYFIRAGSYTVNVRTSRGQATHTFIVRAPQAHHPRITTCKVDLSTPAEIGLDAASWVGPGVNRSCPGGGFGLAPLDTGHPGIEWRFPVHASTRRQAGVDESGELAMIQLVSVHQPGASGNCERVANAADSSAFYDSMNVVSAPRTYIKLTAGHTNIQHDRDSPHMGLGVREGTWYESFYARDYLMYRSDRPGSRWVNLASTSWSWNATVSRAGLFRPWRLVSARNIGNPERAFTTRVDTPQFSRGVSPC